MSDAPLSRRPLFAALALALLGLALGPLAASGGAGTRVPSCRNGIVVELGPRSACVKTATFRKQRGTPSLAQARSREAADVSDTARLRRLLGRRARPIPAALKTPARRIMATLVKAQQAAPRARAAEAKPVVDPPVYVPPSADQAGAGTVTNTTHQQLTSNGQPVRLDAKASQSLLADQCPDEQGEIHGTFADALTMSATVGPMGKTRMRIVVTSTKSTKAKVTAHVGPDAKIKDFDAVVDVETRIKRQTLGPAGLEHFGTDETVNHVHFVLVGIKLNSTLAGDLTPQHLQSVSISRNGSPALATVKGGQVIVHKDFVDEIAKSVDLVEWGASAPLKEAEAIFSSGKCLTATFSPAKPTFAAGATDTDPITVTVTDRKGRPVDILLHAHTAEKGVTPAQAQTGTAGASFVVSTEPQAAFANLQVEGTSNRGTVAGETSGDKPTAKAYGYRVHLSGTGGYHETDDRSDETSQSHEQYDTDFSYTADWPDIMPLILRVDGGPVNPYGYGARTATMSGTTTASGTYTDVNPASDASFTCSGPVADQGQFANSIAVAQSASGTALTIDLYGFLVPDLDTKYCQTTGTKYGTQRQNSIGSDPSHVSNGPKVTVPVSLDLLRQPSFTLQLHPDPLPSCHALYGTCTDSADFSATITFTRIETCTPTSGDAGYSCSRP